MRPKKIYVSDDALYTVTTLGKKLTHPDKNLKNTEYTDLSQVWHDAEEHPESADDILIKHHDGYTVGWYSKEIHAYYDEGGEIIDPIVMWAYLTELLPKGGAEEQFTYKKNEDANIQN